MTTQARVAQAVMEALVALQKALEAVDLDDEADELDTAAWHLYRDVVEPAERKDALDRLEAKMAQEDDEPA